MTGNFEIIKTIKESQNNSYYIGRHKILGFKCLIKVMNIAFDGNNRLSERISRIAENEIRLLSNMNFSFVPRIYEAFKEDNKQYIIMEYIEGESLDQLLVKRGRFTENEVNGFGLEISDYLREMHESENKIIHRDIKLSNLLIGDDGRIYLIDFGNAVDKDDHSGIGRMNIGTEIYASPELMEGSADWRTDIYALGKVLFRLLTGYPLQSMNKLSLNDIYRELKSHNVSHKMMFIILKCCIENREARVQSAAELYYMLQAADISEKEIRRLWQYMDCSTVTKGVQNKEATWTTPKVKSEFHEELLERDHAITCVLLSRDV